MVLQPCHSQLGTVPPPRACVLACPSRLAPRTPHLRLVRGAPGRSLKRSVGCDVCYLMKHCYQLFARASQATAPGRSCFYPGTRGRGSEDVTLRTSAFVRLRGAQVHAPVRGKERLGLVRGTCLGRKCFQETSEPDPPVWGLPTVATFLKNQKTLPVDFLVPAACQQPQVTLVLLTPSQGSGPSPSQGQVFVTGCGCVCMCRWAGIILLM